MAQTSLTSYYCLRLVVVYKLVMFVLMNSYHDKLVYKVSMLEVLK